MKKIIALTLLLPLVFLKSCGNVDTTKEVYSVTPQNKITFCAVGDNIIHSAVYTDAKTPDGYDFSKMYAGVSDIISSSDVAFINQETICSGYPASGYPLFQTPDEIAEALLYVGFNVVNMANNHMLDGDTEKTGGGFLHAVQLWQSKKILSLGAYRDEHDASVPRVMRKGDINIAFLAYTYGTNVLPTDDLGFFIPYINEENIEKDIKEAKKISDFVVVSVHFGDENSKEPTKEQRILAAKMAKWGADAIIGHHSHVLQSIETIQNGDRKTLVAYSLGNFLSTQTKAENILGGILKFDIVKEKNGTRWENVKLIPTVCHYGYATSADISTRGNIGVYPLSEYTAQLCERHGANIKLDDLLNVYERQTAKNNYS